MKKGKRRNKQKKTRSRLLWIAIAVIGIAAVISAVCVAGMLATKENAWRTPEELLVEYMDHIPKQEYEEMYAINNKWSIRKKFERGEVMITTARFLGYDKNEYGDLIVNRKEAEIVSLTFDLYLLNVGSSRIGELLDYMA